jgi:hypothetical protein
MRRSPLARRGTAGGDATCHQNHGAFQPGGQYLPAKWPRFPAQPRPGGSPRRVPRIDSEPAFAGPQTVGDGPGRHSGAALADHSEHRAVVAMRHDGRPEAPVLSSDAGHGHRLVFCEVRRRNMDRSVRDAVLGQQSGCGSLLYPVAPLEYGAPPVLSLAMSNAAQNTSIFAGIRSWLRVSLRFSPTMQA